MYDKIKKLIIAVEKKRSADWNAMVNEINRLTEAVAEVTERNKLLERRIVTLTKRTLNEGTKTAGRKGSAGRTKKTANKSKIDTGDTVLNEVLNSTKPLPSEGPAVSKDEKVPVDTLNKMGILKDYRQVMKAIDTKQKIKRSADQ